MQITLHTQSLTHAHAQTYCCGACKKSWRTTPLENKLRTVHRVKWQDGCLINYVKSSLHNARHNI